MQETENLASLAEEPGLPPLPQTADGLAEATGMPAGFFGGKSGLGVTHVLAPDLRSALIALGWAPPAVARSMCDDADMFLRQLAHAEKTIETAFEAGDDAFAAVARYRRAT